MAGDCMLALLLKLIALFEAVFFQHELSRFSLLMEIGSHNVFSDASFSGPNIQVSQNQVKLAFKVLGT